MELLLSDNSYSCSRKGATIYYIVYSKHNQFETYWYQGNKRKIYRSSKKLVTLRIYILYSCFDFLARSLFTLMNSEVAWVLVSSGTQVQPQIILDPDYRSNYLSVLLTMKYYFEIIFGQYTCMFSSLNIKKQKFEHWLKQTRNSVNE